MCAKAFHANMKYAQWLVPEPLLVTHPTSPRVRHPCFRGSSLYRLSLGCLLVRRGLLFDKFSFAQFINVTEYQVKRHSGRQCLERRGSLAAFHPQPYPSRSPIWREKSSQACANCLPDHNVRLAKRLWQPEKLRSALGRTVRSLAAPTVP